SARSPPREVHTKEEPKRHESGDVDENVPKIGPAEREFCPWSFQKRLEWDAEALRNHEIRPGRDLIMHDIPWPLSKDIQSRRLVILEDFRPPVKPSLIMFRHLAWRKFPTEQGHAQKLSTPRVVYVRSAADNELESFRSEEHTSELQSR